MVSEYVISLAFVRVKGGKSECYRINSVRHVYIMSSCLFNVYMEAVMKEVKMWDGEDGSEIYRGGEKVEITWPLVCR